MSLVQQVFVSLLAALLGLASGCLSTENQRFGCDFAVRGSDGCQCRRPTGTPDAAPPEEGQVQPGGRLAIRLPAEPSTMLSAIEPSLWNNQIIDHAVLETLVRFTPVQNQYEPALASSFAMSASELQYTFHLRRDVLWHDGEPFTADDVVYTFSTLADPTQVFARRNEFIQLESVEATGEAQVTFSLSAPDPGFLLAASSIPILPAHVFKRSRVVSHPAARSPVGTGPFRVRRWVPGNRIELERNPSWRGTPPAVSEVIYYFVADDRVAGEMLERGALDIVLAPSPSLVVQGNQQTVRSFDLPLFDHWIYNTRHPAFSEASVRRALAHALDIGAIRCAIYRCRASTASHLWFSNRQPQLPHRYPLGYDSQKSNRLLTLAGWHDHDGDGIREKSGQDLSFTLTIADNNREIVRAAAAIQYDLKQVGAAMRIRILSQGAFYERLDSGAFDAAVVLLSAHQHADPGDLFHTDAARYGVNFGHFSHPEVDAFIDALAVPMRARDSQEVLGHLELLLAEQHPWTPFLRRSQIALVGPRVRGWNVSDGRVGVRNLWLSRPERTNSR